MIFVCLSSVKTIRADHFLKDLISSYLQTENPLLSSPAFVFICQKNMFFPEGKWPSQRATTVPFAFGRSPQSAACHVTKPLIFSICTWGNSFSLCAISLASDLHCFVRSWRISSPSSAANEGAEEKNEHVNHKNPIKTIADGILRNCMTWPPP